jgi:hypothetical protein
MLKNKIKKLNLPINKCVVVYANYRTGSTAFCDVLSQKFRLRNYDELFHPDRQLPTVYSMRIPCVIKIMPDHEIPKEFIDLISQSYKIGIKRQSVIEQIASFYICDQTKIWHYKTVEKFVKYEVEFNFDKLFASTNYILDMQKKYAQQKKHFEIVYEDCIEDFVNSQYVKTNKPTNYQEILDTIRQILNEKL